VLVIFCLSTKSFAADISGQVVTVEGEPICALVLASGRSMFSCNPIGEYSLTGLPLEPDGSVNLQVYAEGFFPYLKNITQFGSQPPVVMTRAGSCPVDDGLSGGKLDGTYQLIRSSIQYNDGLILDTTSAVSEFSAVGTIVISGNTISTQLIATLDGQTFDLSKTSTFEDGGYYIRFKDIGVPVTNDLLVERGNKLIIASNANQIGSDYNEVSQWAKISNDALAVQSSTVFAQENASSSNFSGIGLGYLIDSMGIRALLLGGKSK
jgi:hypothetical protein